MKTADCGRARRPGGP